MPKYIIVFKKALTFMGITLAVAVVSFTASIAVSRQGGIWTKNQIASTALDRFAASAEHEPESKLVQKITTEEASFPFLLPGSTTLLYYHARTGDIKRLDLAKLGTPERIATIKAGALAITWSPDGKELIASYGTELRSTNLTTGASKAIAKNILVPTYGRANEIAYLYYDEATEEGAISLANGQFAQFKNILKTRLKNWDIAWNTPQRLSLTATSVTNASASLFLLDTRTGALEKLLEGERELQTLWSPDGSVLLYSQLARVGRELRLLSVNDNRVQNLKLAEPASRCTWSPNSTTLYCALGTDSTLVKIRAVDGTQETLLEPDVLGFADIREMTYVSTLDSLVFKNFKDGRLYLARLEK